MSAEGIGIVLTAIGLFITIIIVAVGGAVAYGTLKTMVANVVKQMDKMEASNREGHEKIYANQKDTDIKVGKIETHLLSINGSIQSNTLRIAELERDNNKG